MVRWACGSRSMRQTRLPCSARAAPRLTVVVVLPTPPFWFISAMIRMRAPPCVLWKWVIMGAREVITSKRGCGGAVYVTDESAPQAEPLNDEQYLWLSFGGR